MSGHSKFLFERIRHDFGLAVANLRAGRGRSLSRSARNFRIDQSTPYLMSRVTGLLNQRLHAFLLTQGLTFQHWRVLAALGSRPQPTIAEISGIAVVPHSTLSRLLDRMEKQKLVQRRSSSSDGRTAQICMTSRGRKTLAAIWPRAIQIRQEAMAKLSAKESKQLHTLLEKMRVALSPPDESREFKLHSDPRAISKTHPGSAGTSSPRHATWPSGLTKTRSRL